MTTYWLNDPMVLFSCLQINPLNSNETKVARYNALARITIITTIVLMIVYKSKTILLAGILSLAVSTILFYSNKNTSRETIVDTRVSENTVFVDEVPDTQFETKESKSLDTIFGKGNSIEKRNAVALFSTINVPEYEPANASVAISKLVGITNNISSK